MADVTPVSVLTELSDAVPADCRENIFVIGCLAAGYHYFAESKSKAVRTKDVNCVLEPFHIAVGVSESIARKLLDSGWKRQTQVEHTPPGGSDTAEQDLTGPRKLAEQTQSL